MRTRLIFFVAVALTVAAVAPAQAGNFLVNATFDAVDANVGNGICASASGHCTLRAAFQEAQANPDADVIVLDTLAYKDTLLTPNGVLKGIFKEGADTKSKIPVRGKRSHLAFLRPPWTQPGGVRAHVGATVRNTSAEYKHVSGQ